MTPTWYVTFEAQKRGILPKSRSPRGTKTFATEHEAKAFAITRLGGLALFAGTINPHSPKQLIPSSRVHTWLYGEQVEGGGS
ncbi:hypothetical protein QA633_33415 [Bradyrhizobium barranii]|jgi:hypothetical protein|nr:MULTISPECIES: hypothetical protein [Bradyrhizobium]WFT93180.1 hypothetical protein QA633_33415 [Bradyrhizobium barranii]